MVGELVRPDAAHHDSHLDAVREFEAGGETTTLEREMAVRDFEGFVDSCLRWERGERLPEGWVPMTTRWLVDDDGYIGTVNIRHRLTEHLLRIGGHVGYAIRPSRRRMGHGTEILRLALPVCRDIGLERVLVTCDDTNVGSRKIIESNGGELEDVVPVPGAPAKRRYWITVQGA